MCKELNSEPVEEDIPVEIGDFYIEVQKSLLIYRLLDSIFAPMSGEYLGKSFNNIVDILNINNIPLEEHKTYLELLKQIDDVKIDLSQKESEAKRQAAKNKNPAR